MVRVSIYDERGGQVAVPFDGELGAATHEIVWNGVRSDGSPLPSGRYYYRIESGDLGETGMMMLVR
jgi:flagellar hook assembly protein FlgD